jgi:3-hydroxyisobutyrate dehydrogenase-like beta-hydroxyacid dehydrogenase
MMMYKYKLGFIGFGEAAYLISRGLISENLNNISAFDVNQNHQVFGKGIQDRANTLGISLKSSLKELIETSEIIISATSAKYAFSVAQEAFPYLKGNQLFVDINASSPMVKENIAELLRNSAKFMDVAVVESIPNFKHKVPLLVSGEGAEAFKAFGEQYNMNMTIINEIPGSASAIKMIRSVFMKGFTSLLIETLCASEKYDVTDYMMSSLENSITTKPLAETANLLINRTATHAERRVAEMEEVVKTLHNLNVDPLLSEATKAKLKMYVDIQLKNHFVEQEPKDYMEVIKKINESV